MMIGQGKLEKNKQKKAVKPCCMHENIDSNLPRMTHKFLHLFGNREASEMSLERKVCNLYRFDMLDFGCGFGRIFLDLIVIGSHRENISISGL